MLALQDNRIKLANIVYRSYEYYAVPQASDNVFRIISILVISFCIEWVASVFLYGRVALPLFLTQLSLQFNHNFHFLQLLTHPLLHTNLNLIFGLLNVFFTSLILFFFGSDLERTWGSHHFLRYFLFGIMGAVLLAFFVSFGLQQKNLIYHGIAGGNAALMIAYAMFWPERQILFMFFIPMRMKWFIVVIFILLILSGGSAAIVQYSGGALTGAFFLYYYARKSNQPTRVHLEQTKSSVIQRWEEYQRKKRLQKKQQEIAKRIEMKAKVDALLEKISKDGIASLSRQEKKFLDHASHEL